MANLVGKYQLQKSNLVKNGMDGSLVIGKRQKPSPKKPLNYLLFRSKSGKHTYISSLYPIACNGSENDPVSYSLDLDGKYYTLTIDRLEGVGIITNHNSTNTINNVELGVKFTPFG
jgi:hypothetical protein